MNIKSFLILLLFLENILCDKSIKKLARVRRYLAFPEGSSYSAVLCLTNLMGITPGSDIMSMNINWGLVYELPNDTRPLLDIYKPAAKRRNRRDLYGRVEKILTVMGYDGRSCVLRSLCEAEHKLIHKEDSLTHKILNLIFHYSSTNEWMVAKLMGGPSHLFTNMLFKYNTNLIDSVENFSHWFKNYTFQEPILNNEPDIHHIYHYASQTGRNDAETRNDIIDKCSETFKCPFSLIDLALGYYSYSYTGT